MANRYWVGSTGTWTLTLTTNWAATSGGVGGSSAPTAVDDVYFDLNSNPLFTCTVTVLTATCASLNVIGLSKPITLNFGTLYTNTLTIYGALGVSTTVTNFNFSSTSPSWTTATYNVFTTKSFIVFSMTATSVISSGTFVVGTNKISGSANVAGPPIFPIPSGTNKISGAGNIGKTPLFPAASSTASLAFISNYPLSFPALPIYGIDTMRSVPVYPVPAGTNKISGAGNIGETPLFPAVASTASLAFIPKYITLPPLPIKDIEKFGLNSSNTIAPIPYQFWG